MTDCCVRNGSDLIRGKILFRPNIPGSVHYIFTPSDFVDMHKDTNKRRDRVRADKKLQRRYLKDDAVPSIFPNAPEYLSKAGSSRRATVKATSAKRHQQEVAAMQQQEETFMNNDDISDASITDIATRQSCRTVTQ